MLQKTVIGIFADREDAEDAIVSLKQEDYNPKDISIIMRDSQESQDFTHSTGTNVVGGATTGATTGAVIGGIAGLLVGIGAIAIPGVGALLVGGPLAAALGLSGAAATTVSGAATGALAGGLLGALMGLGIPEEDARIYEDRVRAGGILVAVLARPGEEDDIESILEDTGADTIRSLSLSSSRVDEEYVDEEIDEDGDHVDNYAPLHMHQHSHDAVMSAGSKGGRAATHTNAKRRTRIRR